MLISLLFLCHLLREVSELLPDLCWSVCCRVWGLALGEVLRPRPRGVVGQDVLAWFMEGGWPPAGPPGGLRLQPGVIQ